MGQTPTLLDEKQHLSSRETRSIVELLRKTFASSLQLNPKFTHFDT